MSENIKKPTKEELEIFFMLGKKIFEYEKEYNSCGYLPYVAIEKAGKNIFISMDCYDSNAIKERLKGMTIYERLSFIKK